MVGESHRRINYLIKKRFQFKYTISIVTLLLVVMFASGIGLYMGMWGSIIENFSNFKVAQNLETAKRIADYESVRYKKGDYRLERIFREAELLSQEQKDALKKALASVNRSLAPKVLILVFFIFIGGIFLSHHIAGPMYRIEKSAEAIRDGDLRVDFHTRKGDEMRETTSVLEEMVESLNNDIKKIKGLYVSLEERIDALTQYIPKEDIESLRKDIKDIDALLSKYKI